MSVHISVSNKDNNCIDILEKFKKLNINCRGIKTLSIVDSQFEKGCLLTFGKNYNSKKDVNNLWNIINSNNDYTCSYLNIEGLFSGCILDYINCDNCK